MRDLRVAPPHYPIAGRMCKELRPSPNPELVMPETPVFPAAAVAAPHALAAESGRAILAEGGNAVEAMLAMAATIALVYPHMNAIGGDGFWLVREPRGRVHALDASGPAGSPATLRRYREKGYDAVPARGPDAALTVAGAVGSQKGHACRSAPGGVDHPDPPVRPVTPGANHRLT